MRIATWNIAGGRKLRSDNRFDYHERNLDYFIGQLQALELDVICLQEVEHGPGVAIAAELASALNMAHVLETKMHVSHIDAMLGISLAVLSKRPLQGSRAIMQPYPKFPLTLPSGKPDQKHTKYLQVAQLDDIQISNTQTQPLEYLGTPYESERGKTYADELSDIFIHELHRPVIFAGDFCADLHTTHVAKIYDKACAALQLHDVLPAGQTKPFNKGRADAIFVSPELHAKDSGIVQTETDHFLCWADIEPA